MSNNNETVNTSFGFLFTVILFAILAAVPFLFYSLNKYIIFVPWSEATSVNPAATKSSPPVPLIQSTNSPSPTPSISDTITGNQVEPLDAPSAVVTDNSEDGSIVDTVFGQFKLAPYNVRFGLFTLFAVFSISISASILGVLLSSLTRGSSLYTVANTHVFKGALTVCLVASISATILILLFISGIVSGELFPNINASGHLHNVKVSMTDWAKLTIWSFVSGFYERFIPTTLDNLVKKTDNSLDKTTS
jgi:hypothetical protein